MKKIIAIFILTFTYFGAFSQKIASNATNVNVTNGSTIPATPIEALVLKEIEYNFGKIPQGKPVTHVFEVSNIGKDSLLISNVAASCGCTTPEWEKDKKIPVGASSKINVGYNAAAEGLFLSSESFISNIEPHIELIKHFNYNILDLNTINCNILHVNKKDIQINNLKNWDTIINELILVIDKIYKYDK